MILLAEEKIEVTSDNKALTLTNIRVQYQIREWGKAKIVSILLKNISSVEITYKSNIVFAGIAIVVLLLTVIEGSYILYGAFISIVFALLFFISRRHYLIISSKGGAKINLLVKGMKTSSILEFLNKVEKNIITYSK